MGWPREVLPVLQQPLCSLPILAVAVVLDVGTLWLYDRQLRRAIPALTERHSMALLVGSKQLARVQGDDAQGHVTEAMFSVPGGTTTWLPMPVTPLTPWASRRSLRLGREDNAWF